MALKHRKRKKWLKKMWRKLQYKYETDKAFRKKCAKYEPYIGS